MNIENLKDVSIPATKEEIVSERDVLYEQHPEVDMFDATADVSVQARYDYLTLINDTLGFGISLEDIKILTPDEIDDLHLAASLDTSLSSFIDILGGARKEVKKIILLNVLGLTREDLQIGNVEPTEAEQKPAE